MLKNYHEYIFENVQMSLDMIIEIIRSLKGTDNSVLMNKLVNYSDKNGKTVLMSLVHSNKMDLVDFILDFDVDINKVDKFGRNVLFYCKTIKMFNVFYDKGVDVTFIDEKTDKNLLAVLSSKNIFNVKLYQELIDKGVDINKTDKYNNNAFSYSISRYKIVELLIKNGADINNDKPGFQKSYFDKLFSNFTYFKNKRSGVINTVKLLFNNGLKFVDPKFLIYHFANEISSISSFREKELSYKDFIYPLRTILSEEVFIEMIYNWRGDGIIEGMMFILDMGVYPEFYKSMKRYFRHNDNVMKILDDYSNKHPFIEDSFKFNL